MSDPNDTWPEPKYNPGPRPHLHAMGVVSNNYNEFESELFLVFAHHFDMQSPDHRAQIEPFYFQMRERKRLDLIEIVFLTHEKDEAVRKCVSDLLKYFVACGRIRNNLMHAKYSPPFFGEKEGKLHLDKRKNQSSSKLYYMELDIDTLREAADNIRIGFDCCRELQWYLLCRDIPKPTAAKWRAEIAVLPASLPKIPFPPNTLEPLDKPHIPPLPPYL